MPEPQPETEHIADVVREVLADHIWTPRKKGPAECWSANDRECRERFTTGGQYRTHVADLIADRLTVAPDARATLRWLAVQEEAHELQRTHPDWRWGQSLFNALHAMDPDLANQIRGTAADPFHDVIRAPEFMEAVMRGISTPPATDPRP